jgi:hypothetical protein
VTHVFQLRNLTSTTQHNPTTGQAKHGQRRRLWYGEGGVDGQASFAKIGVSTAEVVSLNPVGIYDVLQRAIERNSEVDVSL